MKAIVFQIAKGLKQMGGWARPNVRLAGALNKDSLVQNIVETRSRWAVVAVKLLMETDQEGPWAKIQVRVLHERGVNLRFSAENLNVLVLTVYLGWQFHYQYSLLLLEYHC
jgi:hypothetical protein